MLELEAVTYRYAGARAPSLVEVSLSLGPGEVVGLIGPNEAGKSTTCLVAAGLAPRAVGGALTGRAQVDGRSLPQVPPGELAELVGIGFAAANLSGICSTVYEEVAFGPMNLGMPRTEVMARTERALAAVAIPHLADRDPERLSGGQRQLVALAGVLAMEPRHLILDEPTAMLDPAGTRLVGEAIAALAARWRVHPDRGAEDRPAGRDLQSRHRPRPRPRGPRGWRRHRSWPIPSSMGSGSSRPRPSGSSAWPSPPAWIRPAWRYPA